MKSRSDPRQMLPSNGSQTSTLSFFPNLSTRTLSTKRAQLPSSHTERFVGPWEPICHSKNDLPPNSATCRGISRPSWNDSRTSTIIFARAQPPGNKATGYRPWQRASLLLCIQTTTLLTEPWSTGISSKATCFSTTAMTHPRKLQLLIHPATLVLPGNRTRVTRLPYSIGNGRARGSERRILSTSVSWLFPMRLWRITRQTF
mmetsp:Transcript_8566/g.17881  ORF Transcript_8566/g.17881 Transcript_8566/m.17881 type:complete len:202 (-) Transcript_8566:523-1128(-)